MAKSLDTMKNFVNVLKLYSEDTKTDGIEILDHAVKETTRFSSLENAVDSFIADMAMVTKNFDAKQSLYQNCGIIIGKEEDFTADTGAVSGYNAGNRVIKDAQSIVPEDTTLDQVDLPEEGSKTVHTYTGADGKTFTYTITYPESYLQVRDNSTSPVDKDGNPDSTYAELVYLQPGQIYRSEPDDTGEFYSATYNEAVAAIQTLMKGIENFWADEGLKLAYDTFGYDFDGKNLSIFFGINQSSQAETGPTADDPAKKDSVPANNIGLEINLAMYAKIDPTDPNGNTRIKGGAQQNYLDRTFAHELIHAVMQASGTLKNEMPEFFSEGIAELIHGVDDYDGNFSEDIIGLAEDSKRLDKAMVFKAGTGTNDAYPAGYMFLRYLCKQSFAESGYINDIIDAKTQVLAYSVGNAGGGNIEPPEYDNQQIVVLNDGNQTLTFGDEDHRVAVVGENSFGTKNIIFGDGISRGIFTAPDSIVNVTVGAGKDTIIVDNQSNVHIDLTAAEDSKIFLFSGKINLDGYAEANHTEIILPKIESMQVDSVKRDGNTLQFADSNAAVKLNDSNSVEIITDNGFKTFFNWSPTDGGLVDSSDIDKKQFIFGGAPNGSSTIIGGVKTDTIIADAGDVVNLSGGNDKIYLDHTKSGGVTIDMGDGSTATRTEVVEGIDLDNDKIKIDSDNISARMLNGKLALEKGNTRLSFAEFESFADADGLQVSTGSEVYTLRSNYDSGISNADFFWQDNNDRYYKAGTDFYIVDNSDNRDYHIGTTAGNMTIDDFKFGTEGDAICLNSVEGLNAGGNDVYVQSPDGKRVIISGGAGQVIKVKDPANNIYVAELGKQLTYNDDVEYYGDLQGETGCAISVGADYGGSEVAVYLNGARETNGRSKTYMGVNKIDASAFTGEASLVGAELDDYIIASQGDTSLWGGNGGNDILVGTGYGNTFFYTKGDGNDEIRNAADGDVINLGDITLDDISSALIMNSGVKLDFKDGGNLTLSNAADVTFKLGDGSSYKANYTSHSWQQQNS